MAAELSRSAQCLHSTLASTQSGDVAEFYSSALARA